MSEQQFTVQEFVKHVFAPVSRDARSGNRTAAIELLAAARLLCQAVERFRADQPELARELARQMDFWPAPVARHLASRRNIALLLTKLELSESHPDKHLLAPDKKGHDLDGEYNSVALEIRDSVRWMRRNKKSLVGTDIPAWTSLESDEFSTWWPAGWQMFVEANNGDIFADDRLKRKQTDLIKFGSNEANSVEEYAERKVKEAALALGLDRCR